MRLARGSWIAALLCCATTTQAAPLPDALRDEAITLHALAQVPVAADDTVTLFAGTRVPQLHLRHVYVRIDGGTLLHHEYNDREGRAMAAGGLDPLASIALAPGEHRLRIELIARHVEDKPGEARIRQRLDLTVTKPAGPWRAGLEVIDLGMTGKVEVAFRDWAPSASPADDDPDVRAVAFLAEAGRPLEARIRLGQLQVQAPGFGIPERVRFALATGESPETAGLGAFNEAAQQLTGPAPNPAALAAFLDSPACARPDADLCDRGRLLLGYYRLRTGDGATAAEAFRAVHVPGPYATRALLGLGWALLAPQRPRIGDATIVPAAYTPDLAARRRARLALPPPGDERREALLAALVPWNDLVGRDPVDAASQEGLLAIAWALDALGAHEQAAARWSSAAAQLESVHGQVELALAQAADGRLAAQVTQAIGDVEDGWDATLAPAAHADPTQTLRTLLADPATSAEIDDLRSVHRLAVLLDADAQALASRDDPAAADRAAHLASVRGRLADAESAQAAQLGRVAHDTLLRLRDQTEVYLAEAHFALARLYDHPGEQEVK